MTGMRPLSYRKKIALAVLFLLASLAILGGSASWWLLFSYPDQAPAKTCELAQGEVLKIACTKECHWTYRLALNHVAQFYGYRLEVETLNLDHILQYDAILSPGGGDISVEYYLNHFSEAERGKAKERYLNFATPRTEAGKKRDRFEHSLHQHPVMQKGAIPFLGVCYGMQMMGVAHGIPLHVDTWQELKILPRRFVLDEVRFSDGSTMLVGKNHHQALYQEPGRRALEEEFSLLATSHDGAIIEMIQHKQKPNLGVQFHPEVSPPEAKFKVLGWLLEQACRHKEP